MIYIHGNEVKLDYEHDVLGVWYAGFASSQYNVIMAISNTLEERAVTENGQELGHRQSSSPMPEDIAIFQVKLTSLHIPKACCPLQRGPWLCL